MMTIDATLRALRRLNSTSFCPPLVPDAIDRLWQEWRIRLPVHHVDVLSAADGMMAYGGFFRLFGVRQNDGMSMLRWNEPRTWKFAWDGHIREYWCFGETAFGDQYAYRIADLMTGASPPVYYLEHITLEAERISRSFDEFLSGEFFRCAIRPYYEFHSLARLEVGDVGWNEHVVHVPSVLISGEESIDRIAKLDAAASMIVNGDLATQLAGEALDREIRKLETYRDSDGRSRVRVVWTDAGLESDAEMERG